MTSGGGASLSNQHADLVCFGTFNEVFRSGVVQPLQWIDVSTLLAVSQHYK